MPYLIIVLISMHLVLLFFIIIPQWKKIDDIKSEVTFPFNDGFGI